MFQRILEWIRSAWNKMFATTNIKQALNVDVMVSPVMQNALIKWAAMYRGQPEWLSKEGMVSLGLPATISSEIARMVTIEMGVEVTGSPRADYLHEQMKYIVPKLRQKTEYGNALGGMVIKPYNRNGKIAVDYVAADCFYPVSFDGNGCMTAVIFSDVRKQGQYWYTRLEYHNWMGTSYMIRNMAFKSSTENTIGNACSLSEVSDWAELEPEATITNVTAPLYGYFRYPLANNKDPLSPLGVSCFSRAEELIRNADEVYSSLVWEFESGKRAIYADELAFERDQTTGKPKLPDRRLYRTLASTGNLDGKQKLFEAWSPEFREAAIKAGLNDIKREIEFSVGLAYGTLSDPQTVDKTATEMKISQQRTYSTIADTQKALEVCLDETLYAMDVYATLYNLAPRGSYEATYEWDDSIVKDYDSQFAQDTVMVEKGAMSLVELRMRTYGETKEVAAEKIAMINEERRARVAERVNQVRVNQPDGKMPTGAMSEAMNNGANEYSPAG